MYTPGTPGMMESHIKIDTYYYHYYYHVQTGSASAQINLIRCLTEASPAENTSNNTWNSTLKSSVMKTILFGIELSEAVLISSLISSVQTKLNGYLRTSKSLIIIIENIMIKITHASKIHHTLTRTHVSPPVPSQVQIVRHVLTPHISSAPSQGSVSILTSNVTATLSV